MQSLETLLTDRYGVSADEVQKAFIYQKRNGGRIEQILVRMGALSSETLPDYYATVFELPRLSDQQFTQLLTNAAWLEQMRSNFGIEQLKQWEQQGVIPIALTGEAEPAAPAPANSAELAAPENTTKPAAPANSPEPAAPAPANSAELAAPENTTKPAAPASAKQLVFITATPADFSGQEAIRASVPDIQLQCLVCQAEQFAQIAERIAEQSLDNAAANLSLIEEDRLRELATEAPTVNLLNNLISKGLRQRASDMHIEPRKHRGVVRYRIDGVLHEAETIPAAMLLPVVTRLKLLSRMDIAEKRRPQDGKIELRVDGRNVDIRVSALPVGEGESVVMRFLLQDSLSYDIKTLGIEADIEQRLLEDLQTTSGVILLTGPTGSGKTTSLYSFLSRRNEPGVKIITIEDPVEYQLEGINQVQVQSDIGLTFANALRSVVRQDPDIIMVGEIRDYETASIALQSALTGHLVFSTLHTNDAASAYTRLLDLGVEDFLLSAAVKAVVAQRLVRRLCPHCREADAKSAQDIQHLKLEWLAQQQGITPSYYRPKGCEACGHTGYAGRVAIVEYLSCDDELRRLIGKSDFLVCAAELNRQRGYRNLLEDGALKAMRGETSLAEVLRVAS